MCFLPNRRASIDQAPGPIIAMVNANAAANSLVTGKSVPSRKSQTCAKKADGPAMGVDKPSNKNNPEMPLAISGTIVIPSDPAAI